MRNLIISVLLIGIFLIVGCVQQPAAETTEESVEVVEAEVIKVGFMGPLSGDAASYGESIKRGVDLAMKEMGLDNVELVVEDSKCEGKEAVTAINKLISLDGVVAIVGEVCSGATLAAAPIANENNVPMVSPSSTSPKVSEQGEYTFRTVPSDALQGDFGANLAYDRGYRKLAVLYTNEEYGLGFNNVLTESFAALGGEVVASETFERGAVDIRTQLTKTKDAEPDVIYIISNSPDSTVAALQQMTELGIEAAIFGSEGQKSPAILEGAGESAEGMVVTAVSSGTSGFIERHQAEYGEAPGPFAAQGYDAFKAIGLAVEQGATTGEEIKNALFGSDFDGASGHIVFDENGDVSGNYDVFEVQNGEFVLTS
ncbi:MAG: penicillin-binding protein activator [Nanoarchaeota archaeon]|nr:penicillin-binding protein activator [DPANN group archaeon]MBL7117108.1 penicillin-binding protein activator [Nanoarchaeota archaeon]